MNLNKEDIKLLPLVALGLARGIGEVLIKPLVDSFVSKLPLPSQAEIDEHIVVASIQYYRTGEADDVAIAD